MAWSALVQSVMAKSTTTSRKKDYEAQSTKTKICFFDQNQNVLTKTKFFSFDQNQKTTKIDQNHKKKTKTKKS